MAKIKAFKAIRPTRDKAHLVATRPVASYKNSVLKAKLETNPYSFIHIINPEFGEIVKTKPNSKERFLNIRKQFNQFCNSGILIQEKEESIYLYRQTKDGNEYLGIIAGASVEEYKKDQIKKHEATLTSREAMFTNYLDIVGFNAEPVLLSYPSNESIDSLLLMYSSMRPEYEFSTTDEVKHELWVLDATQSQKIISAFEAINTTYIADGHHRSASSARLADLFIERHPNEAKTNQNHNYFLAFFMNEQSLNILEFNRLVKNIKGLSEKDFLARLTEHFEITPLEQAKKPEAEHKISMNLMNKWYELTCKTNIIDKNHPVASLDPEILTRFILDPILGIKDLKSDTNIQFISGNLGLNAISDPIAKGKAEVGFVLYPLSIEQVKQVADHHLIMPPKSTWVEPKLRSGLTIYQIEQ